MVSPQLLKTNSETLRGVLNINKPSGISSFDVIRAIKRIIYESESLQKKNLPIKLGHAGTLDPMANGVLLILFNEATKINPFLMEQKKEYLAEIRLGIRTDSDDITGKVLEEKNIPTIPLKQIKQVLSKFEGEISQNPPSFSALHAQGKRLYEIARAGKTVETKPRQVSIDEIELIKFVSPILTIRTIVSKGTYIRALARDIGNELGCGATLNSLTRTRIGNFKLTQSIKLADLTLTTIQNQICPIAQALPNLKSAYIKPSVINKLLTGQPINFSELSEPDSSQSITNGLVMLSDSEQKIVAIAQPINDGFKPIRLIYADIPKK
jgi:tRNA pseudouridine55 synthase